MSQFVDDVGKFSGVTALACLTTRVNIDVVPEAIDGPSRHGLGWLLQPVTVREFLRDYWEKRPFAIDRGAPGYYEGLPNLDDVDELIIATSPAAARSADDGRLVRTDEAGRSSDKPFVLNEHGLPDIQDIYRWYRSGYSVVLNQINHRSTAVAGLCRAVEAVLAHRVSANLYLTPRSSQGFRLHVDQHDVLVVQIHGKKRWHVEGEAVGRVGPSGPSMVDGRRVDLGPGDLLYLPRGVPHQAVTTTASSLHLTIGIHVHTWADLVAEVIAILVRRAGTTLQKGLPPGYPRDSADETCLREASTELAAALRDGALVEQAMLNLSGRLFTAGNAAVRGQFRAIDELESMDGRTRLRRAAGIHCRVRTIDDQVRIDFANNYVSGPSSIESALRFVAGREQFTIDEIPGDLSVKDRLALVDRLVSEGLLSVHGPNQVLEET